MTKMLTMLLGEFDYVETFVEDPDSSLLIKVYNNQMMQPCPVFYTNCFPAVIRNLHAYNEHCPDEPGDWPGHQRHRGSQVSPPSDDTSVSHAVKGARRRSGNLSLSWWPYRKLSTWQKCSPSRQNIFYNSQIFWYMPGCAPQLRKSSTLPVRWDFFKPTMIVHFLKNVKQFIYRIVVILNKTYFLIWNIWISPGIAVAIINQRVIIHPYLYVSGATMTSSWRCQVVKEKHTDALKSWSPRWGEGEEKMRLYFICPGPGQGWEERSQRGRTQDLLLVQT